MQKFIVFAALGTELGGLIFFASFLEKWLGERYGTKGLIFLGLTFIFLIAWFIQIIYLLKRLQSPAPSEPTPSSRPDEASSRPSDPFS